MYVEEPWVTGDSSPRARAGGVRRQHDPPGVARRGAHPGRRLRRDQRRLPHRPVRARREHRPHDLRRRDLPRASHRGQPDPRPEQLAARLALRRSRRDAGRCSRSSPRRPTATSAIRASSSIDGQLALKAITRLPVSSRATPTSTRSRSTTVSPDGGTTWSAMTPIGPAWLELLAAAPGRRRHVLQRRVPRRRHRACSCSRRPTASRGPRAR